MHQQGFSHRPAFSTVSFGLSRLPSPAPITHEAAHIVSMRHRSRSPMTHPLLAHFRLNCAVPLLQEVLSYVARLRRGLSCCPRLPLLIHRTCNALDWSIVTIVSCEAVGFAYRGQGMRSSRCGTSRTCEGCWHGVVGTESPPPA